MNNMSAESFSFYRDEIIGDSDHYHDFYSVNLKNERDIIVWLPPSYNTSFKRYPVLYVHDGQNLFNPQTAFIGVDWRIDETVTALIHKRKIREVIVVGIYNSKDRLEEYNFFTPKGKQYTNFIVRELKSFIDENYRTIKNRENTMVMGSSLGGLFSFQLIWYMSNIFGAAACLSSSFWVDNKKMINEVTSESKPSFPVSIYLDCGSEEKELIDDNKLIMRKLKEVGFVESKDLMTHIEENGKHTESHWAKRLNIPLEFILRKSNVFL